MQRPPLGDVVKKKLLSYNLLHRLLAHRLLCLKSALEFARHLCAIRVPQKYSSGISISDLLINFKFII